MKIDITKQKILDATIKLMSENDDPNKVTVRAIAKEAGVQVSMINYCFGSKENMMYAIYKKFSDEYILENKEIINVLKSDIRPKEKLRAVHYGVAEFILDNFKYTKAITEFFLLHRDMTKPQSSLSFIIEHYKDRKTVEECKLISYELSSIMQLILFRNEELSKLIGIDFNNKKELHKFIDMQLDLFLVD